jgi:DNA mismatch endonuclease (patch repair protein)
MEKFRKNKERDSLVYQELKALGWKIIVVWECETKHREELGRLIEERLKELRKPSD